MTTLEIKLTLPKSQKEILVIAEFTADDVIIEDAMFSPYRSIKSFKSSNKVRKYIEDLFEDVLQSNWDYYQAEAEEKRDRFN